MGLVIAINDLASVVVADAGTALRSRTGAARAAAEGALPMFQRRFREMASTNRNPFGVRGGFWNRMLSGTKAGSEGETGYVRMPREVALRRFGGTVRPKQAKLLAIPARGEAYGKSPRQFSNLRFVALSGGRGMLIERDATRITRGKRGQKTKEVGGGVYFWLVPSVTVRPNAAVLPTDAEIAAAALKGVGTWYTTQVRRGR